MKDRKWGLIGHGDIAEKRIVGAFRDAKANLVSVMGRDIHGVINFSKRHLIEHSTISIVEHLDYVDMIYIATPVSSHLHYAKLAVERGVSALVEKPLAAGFIDSIGFSAKEKSLIGVAYYRRLYESNQTLRKFLKARIGYGPIDVLVKYKKPFTPRPGEKKYWRSDLSIAGGGILADIGCHYIDLLVFCFGEPYFVEVERAQFFDEGGEKKAEVRLWWENQIAARCYFEWTSETPMTDKMIIESKEFLVVSSTKNNRVTYSDRITEEIWSQELVPSGNPYTKLISAFENGTFVCNYQEAAITDWVISK